MFRVNGSKLSLERTIVRSEYIAVKQCAVFPSSSRRGKTGVYSGPSCFVSEDLIHIAQVYKRRKRQYLVTFSYNVLHGQFFFRL